MLVGRHVGKEVGKELEAVKNPECDHLQNILNEPPDDAINPYPQRKELLRSRRKTGASHVP